MLKKILIGIGILFAVAIVLGLVFGESEQSNTDSNQNQTTTQQSSEPPRQQEEKKETWVEVLYDIAEWDKNDGEKYTDKFKVESDTWRVKWSKRSTTQMSIEVYTANDKCVAAIKGNPSPTVEELPDGTRKESCEPFTADFNETEGTIDFKSKGTYYVHVVIGTNSSAGVADVRVEELK